MKIGSGFLDFKRIRLERRANIKRNKALPTIEPIYIEKIIEKEPHMSAERLFQKFINQWD